MMARNVGRPPKKGQEFLAITKDFGTPERKHHGGVQPVAIKPKAGKDVEVVARVNYEHPLDIYRKRAQVNEREFAAGIRFRGLYEFAVGTQVTAAYKDLISGERGAPSDGESRALAHSVVNQILERMETAKQRAAIIGVCGHGDFAGVAFEKEGIRVSGGHALSELRGALNKAADYWGLPKERNDE
ncbi:hypothetical protein [Nisaea sediminum]|uniref:hypothetical protein n=1 Tax=Nisaea sediminum TaxID=2775867 RepID=UPI0018684A71|nr:hypothetical protein [Nisaea sediminum]